MKNVVNYILSAQKKIFVMAFLAVFSSFYTMVWGTAATLPISFDSGKSVVNSTDGFSHSGLGTDYSSSPKLKFDSPNDYLLIEFSGAPDKLGYKIKGYPSGGVQTAGNFDIKESHDNITWTRVKSYSNKNNTEVTESNIQLKRTTRFVKFVYTYQSAGSIAIGAISISAASNTTYTVTFNAGTGKCAQSSASEESAWAGVELPNCYPSSGAYSEGWRFAGWATTSANNIKNSPILYKAGETYYPTSSHTLYAIYELESEKYNIIHDAANLSPGKYLVVNTANKRAMTATEKVASSITGLDTAHVSSNITLSSDTFITNPEGKIVWDVTKQYDTYHFYNSTEKKWLDYTYRSGYSSHHLNAKSSKGEGFGISFNKNGFAIFESRDANRVFLHYPTNSTYRFIASTGTETKNIHLYKQDNTFDSNPVCRDVAYINGTVSFTNPTEAVLTWDDMSNVDGTTPYTITYRTGSDAFDDTNVGSITTNGEGKKTCTITGLSCNTIYDFKIEVTAADGYCDADTTMTGKNSGYWTVEYTFTNSKASKTTGPNAGATVCGNFEATFTPVENYLLPNDISVTIGGAEKTKDTHYTWSVNGSTDVGTLTIDDANIDGNIAITITAEAKAPVSSAWNFWYGTNNADDWTHISFTYTGANNEWQTEVFAIPNKPNWNVNNAAGDDGKTVSTTWDNLYFAASQGNDTRPMVGAAVGAVGKVRIYDNSDWNNRYAGFIPNGYVLKIGSNGYSFASEDGNEYRSEIIEYSGSNARDNVSVGIVAANGDFVSTDNTSEMQHIFLHVGNNTTLWGKDGVTNFGLYDDTEGHKYFTCLMTAVPGENYLYEGWVPSNCTKVIFCRLKSSTLDWGTDNNNVHNFTNSLVLQDNQNLWTVTGWDGGDGSWSAYTQKGRFCIWQNSIEKNWGVCFRPCYEFNATENANWNNANNWKPQSVPTIDFDVFLNKPVTVNVTTAKAKSIVINQEGGNNGQLVVDAGQKLIVAGSIQKTTDGETYSATEANDIIIHSDATHGLGLGALVMGTHDGTNQATVNFTTLSRGTSEDNTSIAQYVGTPFNDETNILHNWYNSWVYGITYDGSKNIGWERVNEGQGMAPFKGYCVFSADGTYHNYWQQGTLVASKNQTISGLNCQSDEGTANPNNENLLANSWVAPIKINAMESSDFTNADATVYIFNSTSNSAYVDLGNYATYPVNSVADAAIIPSMQSFSVFTTGSGASVSLDYSKIVYDPAVGGTVPGPNKAPRLTKAETAHRMKLYVSAENGYSDMLYLLEHLDFEEGFENGWDGHKLFGESVAPQLYAVTPDGNMAVNCVPTYEGVVMGFKAGEQDNSYTFTFEYSDEAQPLYLLDIQTNIYTQITSATSYSFTTTDTEVHNRFVLTYNAPSTPTALETTPAVTTGKKVMYDNHLFILHNGRIFSAQGAMIQ